MWRCIMVWLGSLLQGPGASRLDAAAAGNLTAQQHLREAGEDTAHAASEARKRAVLARWEARKAARRIRDTQLHTSDVRIVVNSMLSRRNV